MPRHAHAQPMSPEEHGSAPTAEIIRMPGADHLAKRHERQKAGAPAPVLLSPKTIGRMIAERQKTQVVKFRTTCSDSVPSF